MSIFMCMCVYIYICVYISVVVLFIIVAERVLATNNLILDGAILTVQKATGLKDVQVKLQCSNGRYREVKQCTFNVFHCMILLFRFLLWWFLVTI